MSLVMFTLVAAAIHFTDASHFRGGTISWTHHRSNGNTHDIEFSFRLGWRRDYAGDICDANMVATQGTTADYGNWNLGSPATSPEFPRSVAIICTSYDISENWAYGFNNFRANITAVGTFDVAFTGSAWIADLFFGASEDWSVAMPAIDLSIRSDKGVVNHPPSTVTSPVIRLQLGCPTTINILTLDADKGDAVSCRYATGVAECAGICGTYSHFNLNEASCSIYYTGGGAAALVPVALMLEDHPATTITLGGRVVTPSDTLSSIPLQFLVKIRSTTACNVQPTYPGDTATVPENANITIPDTGTLDETLSAYPSDITETIVQFVVIGPVGVSTSDIYSPSDGMYAANITWHPQPTQSGKHIICYYAVDSGGKSGKQRCFTVNVAGILSACDADNGGCSDVCVPQGASRTCECSTPCWKLSHDAKTCVPEMNVTCSGKGVAISIAKCVSNRTVVAGTNFEDFTDSTCQSNETASGPSLVFGTLDCGLIFQVNPILIQYVMELWVWEARYTVSSVVTRGEWRKIPVTCSLPVGTNLTGVFLPIPPLSGEFFPEEVEIVGMGEFSLYFEFYRASGFTTSYAPGDYPIQVTVNEEIYFSLGAVGRGGLVFFTERCVAMSNETVETSSLIYPFIVNGCLEDPTLVSHSPLTPMQNRFSMQAFEFEEKLLTARQDAEIFILCQVIICDAADNSSRCAQGCLSPVARRKRSIEMRSPFGESRSRIAREIYDDDDDELPRPAITQSPPQDVASRFIFVVETSNSDEESAGESATISYTKWILIGFGVALLAAGVIIAYCVLKNRKMKMRLDSTT